MKNYLFILFLLFNICLSQNPNNNEIDSLLTLLNKQKTDISKTEILIQIAKSYRYQNPDEGIKYGEKALQLAKKNHSDDQISASLNTIGMNYYNISEIDKAKNYFHQAIKLAKNKAVLCDAYTSLGKYYLAKADYPNSLKYNLKALKLSEDSSLSEQAADASYAIGVTYNFLEKPKKAISYLKNSLKLNQKINRKLGICSSYLGLADQYEHLGNLNTAKEYLIKAKQLANELNNSYAIAAINMSLGRLLFSQNDVENALENIIMAKKTAEKIGHTRLINSSKLLEGKIYYKLYEQNKKYKNINLLNEAETLIKESIELDKSSGNKAIISQSYELLSDIYSLKNEHKKAKETYVIFSRYQDSIYNDETKETIKNLEDKRTIELNNKEIQLNKITLENKEKQKWYYIAGLLLLAIIGSLLFYQSRNRRKTNNKLQLLNTELDEANKAKTRFFSILNHDLRGPVANLIFFLQLQKESPEMLDEESTKRMQDKTITGAENLLNSMEDILQWSKSQMENFKPHPKSFKINYLFEDIQNHFSSNENVKITFENTENIQIVTDEDYLKTIIRNLTGNAIKALKEIENPTIIWKAWQESEKTFLSISDNGNGASKEEFKALFDDKEVVGIKSGLGLHLIRDLAKAIDCEITVNSKLNEGTTFILTLK